jgi:lactose permease
MAFMACAYILFIFFSSNLIVVFVALVLFYLPATCIQMTAILTITDSVEYGQWKTGKRNEAVTLSVRPMLDKIAGALSNSIVGFVAIVAAMTNDVDPSLLTSSNIETFKAAAFYVPLAVIVLAFIVFARKVTLTEAKHGEIVSILEENMASASDKEG